MRARYGSRSYSGPEPNEQPVLTYDEDLVLLLPDQVQMSAVIDKVIATLVAAACQYGPPVEQRITIGPDLNSAELLTFTIRAIFPTDRKGV